MNKRFFEAAFALGLAVLAWVAWGFVGTHPLALAMTGLILGTYLVAALELRRFRAATAELAAALAALASPPASLAGWLERLPAGLRPAVRARIEGQSRSLPGPALTPYLVGLLVMLGMLGTFLGMVVTFQGAVFALEGSADLQAMRSSLAEPIRGLGLAFGTSVAGVATSAMLGLMSALARRERQDSARQLDAALAGALRPFTPASEREATLQALQAQAGVLPQVAAQLEALVARVEARSAQLDAQLSARQDRFYQETQQAYAQLADRVAGSLQAALAAGARVAGESITPVVSGAMAQVVEQSRHLQTRLGEAAEAQVAGLSQHFSATARGMTEQWQAALAAHAQNSQALAAQLQQALEGFSQTFEARSAGLLAQVAEQHQAAQGLHTEAEAQRLAAWSQGLEALRAQEVERAQAAVDRLGALEAAVGQHLAALGASLEAPLARLLHTASEVPQAAAAVIAQLREEMSRLAERDNQSLAERNDLLAQLQALLASVQQAAGEQRAGIESLVDAASGVLARAGERFDALLVDQGRLAGEATQQLQAGAVELASLGEAFAQGVEAFQGSSTQLVDSLERIEAALGRASTRSDEQLAYYVGQAREVIDLSLGAQQELLDHLRQLRGAAPRARSEAEGAAA